MIPLDGKDTAITHSLCADVKAQIPENLKPLYEGAGAQTLAVEPDGSFLYVGAHVRMAGTDGRGMFMAYAITPEKTLSLEYAMLCEIQELAKSIVVTPQYIYMPSFVVTSAQAEHNVYVFDNDAGAISNLGKIEAGGIIETSGLSPDGLLYLTLDASEGGTFVVIDPSVGNFGEVVYRVDNLDERLIGLAFNADGTRIYVSNLGNSSVPSPPCVLVYGLIRELAPPIPSAPQTPQTPESSGSSLLPPTGDMQSALLAALAVLLACGALGALTIRVAQARRRAK
jgi:DNA-binding beta-propeller fold protein YncE